MTTTSANTTNGTHSASDDRLVRPFPEPGPLLRLAYRELRLAAHGSEQQRRALGDHARLPRPWDPASCRQPDLRLELWEWLEAVAAWLNQDYTWDAAAMIPPCWPRHPHLVHELSVLADQRRQAGSAATSDALEDWHRFTLPGFLDRTRSRLRGHCDDDHQSWPGKARHTRHTDETSRAERADAFTADVDTLDAEPARPQRLTVVDLDTGELQDDALD